MRTIPGRPVEPSWLYIPADPVLRDHAATIEHELRRALRRPARRIPRARRAAPSGGRPSARPTPDFVPLSADVAPQMTLFGARPGRSGRRRRRWLDPGPTGASTGAIRSAPASSIVPAFERRAMLRDERHRLVSEVRRRDGTSHREINAWLNRKLGITSVEKATLAELERSVELLYGKLSRRAA